MITFYLGEEKYITAKIHPKKEIDTVVINPANPPTFELINDQGTIVDTDNPTVDGLTLTMLLNPQTTGIFTLKITAHVGGETIITKEQINVRP